MKAPRGETRERVAEMRAAGMTPREVSLALGITTQAVYYHLRSLDRRDA